MQWIKLVFFQFICLIIINIHISHSQEIIDPDSQWYVKADNILSYDIKNGSCELEGNITIRVDNKELTADYARFNYKEKELVAKGNVILKSNDDILKCSNLDLDLEKKTGTIYNGSLSFKKNNFHINGKTIKKTGDKTYFVDDVSVTTCDGDSPDWEITGHNLDVTIEGYGYMTNVAMWIKSIPVLYFPVLVFPVKLERQSGLLFPSFQISDRRGFEYMHPVYWAINKNSDATFYNHYMDMRGDNLGFEFRYHAGEQSKGTFFYNYFEDERIDNGTNDSTAKWGYEDILSSGNDTLRENTDRYWFRTKINQDLFSGFSAKLDIDIVSDQDYLQEFEKEYFTGFDKTNSYFEKNFGRSLDDCNDTQRENSLLISRNWSKFNFNIKSIWVDDMIIRNNNNDDDSDNDMDDTTLQRLPKIEFDGIKQQFLNTPFYFQVDTEYSYFYRYETTSTLVRGDRKDFHAAVYLPVKLGYFSIEPSIGLRETFWNIENDENVNDEDYDDHRELYELNLDLSTELFKIFDIDLGLVDKIRHSIKSQIVYTYIPEDKDSNYPQFDSIDNISNINKVTYSITNTFTSGSEVKSIHKKNQFENKITIAEEDKTINKNDHSGNSDNGKLPEYTYNEFLYLKLSQSYDFYIAANEEDYENLEPFSAITAELRITPAEYLKLESEASWSCYDNEFLTESLKLIFFNKRTDNFSIEHKYIRDSDEDINDGSESILLKLNLVFTDSFLIHGEYEHNLHDDQDIEKSIGFVYTSQCWTFQFDYIEEYTNGKLKDTIYSFLINFHGLGSAENYYKPSKSDMIN